MKNKNDILKKTTLSTLSGAILVSSVPVHVFADVLNIDNIEVELDAPSQDVLEAGQLSDQSGSNSDEVYEVITDNAESEDKAADVIAEEVITEIQSDEQMEATDEEVMNECISETSKSRVPGSVSFVPSVAGLIIASEVIKDICKK